MSAIEKHNQLVDQLEVIYGELDSLREEIYEEIIGSESKMMTLHTLKTSTVKYSLFQKLDEAGEI